MPERDGADDGRLASSPKLHTTVTRLTGVRMHARVCVTRRLRGSLFCVSFLEHDRTQHHVARIASPLAPPSMIGDRIARSGTVRPRSQTAERPRGPLCVLTLTP